MVQNDSKEHRGMSGMSLGTISPSKEEKLGMSSNTQFWHQKLSMQPRKPWTSSLLAGFLFMSGTCQEATIMTEDN